MSNRLVFSRMLGRRARQIGHGVTAGEIAVGLCWLMSRDRPPLARLWPGMVGGAILALPGILPALQINWSVEPQIVAEANDIYVFRRLPHHLVPQSFRWPFIVRYLLMLMFWLVVVLKQSHNRPLHRLNRFVITTLAVSLAGMILALLTASVPESQAALLRYYWFRLADVMLPVGIALGAVVNLAGESPDSQVQSPKRWWRTAGWLAVCAALVVYGRGDYAAWTRFDNISRADKFGKVLSHDDWRDACQWMADNTPRDALAITPRMAQSFTWYAGRGQVVSWKDLPQNAEAVVRWWHRLEDIYAMPHPEFQGRWHESLTELSPERLRKLGEKYGAAYLVVEAVPAIDLPRVYHNGSYAVYVLTD